MKPTLNTEGLDDEFFTDSVVEISLMLGFVKPMYKGCNLGFFFVTSMGSQEKR